MSSAMTCTEFMWNSFEFFHLANFLEMMKPIVRDISLTLIFRCWFSIADKGFLPSLSFRFIFPLGNFWNKLYTVLSQVDPPLHALFILAAVWEALYSRLKPCKKSQQMTSFLCLIYINVKLAYCRYSQWYLVLSFLPLSSLNYDWSKQETDSHLALLILSLHYPNVDICICSVTDIVHSLFINVANYTKYTHMHIYIYIYIYIYSCMWLAFLLIYQIYSWY